jgi:hypothetical protein
MQRFLKGLQWREWRDAGQDGNTRALDSANSTWPRQRPVAEIEQLEAKLATLQERDDAMDLPMQQTCHEMIHFRQKLFLKLC